MDFSSGDVGSLADKLAGLDLSDGESEALRVMAAVSARALDHDDDEVAGFGFEASSVQVAARDFGALSLKLGPPRGFGSTTPRTGVIVAGEEIFI